MKASAPMRAPTLRLELRIPLGWKLLGRCPTCQAESGQPCWRLGRNGPTGRPATNPHEDRARLDELLLEVTTKLLARAARRCTPAEIATLTDLERDWCPEPTPEDELAARAGR
jgi:hypothetical protein